MASALSPEPPAAFYFDLASPLAYLAAERILHDLPGTVEWQPVLARELTGGDPLSAFRCESERQALLSDVERAAAAQGLQPLRWPRDFPFDSLLAMRVATYAKSIGRCVPFAQAAFRQAYAGGHPLHELDFVLIAAAACEMHPRAVVAAAQSRSVADALAAAGAAAGALGVREVPTVRLADRLFAGERALDDAVAHRTSLAGGAADPPRESPLPDTGAH